jgi:hypothetical protein
MALSRLSSVLLVLVACAAVAQAPQRVRGLITASDGNGFTVDGKTQVRLGEKTEIVFAQPIALADLKPGDFLGVTSARHGGGQLIAYEVRRFPKPVNPGHRPFDGRDDQTLTNATVEAMMQSANGRELTMTYAGGTQKITVPPDASVSTLVPGQRSQLVPGAPVNLTMSDDRVAIRIQVGPKK